MTTTLNTEVTASGIELTRSDGQSAGIIIIKNRDAFNKRGLVGWQFVSVNGEIGEIRRTREAAEFDALACAADQDA